MTTVVFFDCYVVTSLVLPILLVFISDVRTVLSWRDALLVPVILSLFASYIKRQVALWGQRRDWVFRVVSSVMCCSVTLSAILQWAFYATAEPPSDGPGELAYYVVIVQCATISLHVIKLSLFNLLHVWYTSALTSQLRGSSDFDTMEEVGLCLHIITSTATLLASVMYIPGDVTPLVQLMVVPHICYIAGTLLLIYRLNNILKPFPEVSTTSDCVICLESVKPMEMGRRLECGHIFHSRCLRRWLMRSERCPTCRTPAFRQQNRVDLTFSASINWNTGIRVEENNETHVLRRPQMPISHEIGVQIGASVWA
uniref:RING-type domain-containing protein n=1 Tax=Trypanosoma vivax (strain Y486) TaxID=1055687 RepID=G0U720_TRYVY|nr:conserved hypothetical protein [Trypanosoma vivax Y486]